MEPVTAQVMITLRLEAMSFLPGYSLGFLELI
jgi:hypothetical protein